MLFDEQKFYSLLGTIDLTSSKIKQIANYMSYYFIFNFSFFYISLNNLWNITSSYFK